MNLNLFKTYVKVVETQNLSRTAEEFGLSQPAVTKQIQALEDAYGVLLLERSGRRLKTTEAGELLYHHSREIIKAVDKTDKAMEEVAESHRGNLYLGASTIPGEYILPHIIKGFKDIYPNIRVSMDIASSEKIAGRVAERELDVGIVGALINNRKLEGYQWLEDELVVVLPPNHRLAARDRINLKELVYDKWVFRQKGSGTRRTAEELLISSGLKLDELNVFMEAGSTEAVLAAVEAGMGVSIVSNWAIQRMDSHRKVSSVGIAEPNASRYFYVIYPHQKSRRRSVIQFINYLKNLEDDT